MKEFKERTPDYGPEDDGPVDRYTQANNDYFDRIGSLAKQKHNWMRATFLLTWTCLVLVGALVFMSMKSTVTPYVVERGPDGSVVAVGPAKNTNYVPQETEIRYHLKVFVERARSLSFDPIVVRNNWKMAYAYMRPDAANKLNAIFKNENPASRIGQETVQVSVTKVSRMPEAKNSYSVSWTEETFGKDGNSKGAIKLYGVFYIELVAPTSEKELMVNPLGIYIRDLNINKEI